MAGDAERAGQLLGEAREILGALGGLAPASPHLEAWSGSSPAGRSARRPRCGPTSRARPRAAAAARRRRRCWRRRVDAQGRLEEAEELCRQAERAAAGEDALTQAIWRASAARILAARGRCDDAEALAREAIAHAEPTDLLSHQGDAMLALAEVLRRCERTDEAERAIRAGRALYDRKGHCRERPTRRSVMPARPNFIKAAIDGDAITLRGESDPNPPGDIVHIRVVLSQDGNGRVRSRAEGKEPDLEPSSCPRTVSSPGPPMAIGIETRRENSATITWTQAVQIPAAPG